MLYGRNAVHEALRAQKRRIRAVWATDSAMREPWLAGGPGKPNAERATGVVIPERRSAEVTPAACKASAGAVEHLQIARVRNIADFLGEAKERGVWCYGAAMAGAVPWTQPDYSGGVALVMGAEGKGLRPRVQAACDQLVALPLRGRIDSLNVSAAAAALMYEVVRTRG